MIAATLLPSRRPARIDYRLLIERVGKELEIDPKLAGQLKPSDPLMLPACGDMIIGVDLDAPYPEPLDRLTQHAYWRPNAKTDIARNKAHLMVFCSWSRFSRLEAHKHHLFLVRELVEQLPVIGVVWGSVPSPPRP